MSGSDNFYRIRSGNYRIIYLVSNDDAMVTIYYIRHRKVAYRHF
ncbi:type II toxin-antitoxin system RelE family toxin [Methanogenium marinum]